MTKFGNVFPYNYTSGVAVVLVAVFRVAVVQMAVLLGGDCSRWNPR